MKNVVLSRNKKVNCGIVLPLPDKTLRFAAEELACYLSKICGTEIKVGQNKQSYNVKINLFVSNELRKKSRLDGEDRFAINVSDKEIVILGENARSVLYGVYSFLEELGCRWYYPDKKHEVVPQLNKVVAKKGYRETWHRLAIRRLFLAPMIGRDVPIILGHIDWMAKNHFNSLGAAPGNYGNGYDIWCTDYNRWPQVKDDIMPALSKRNIKLCMTSHSLHYFMPPEELYSKHPNWYKTRELSDVGEGSAHNRLAKYLTRFFEDPAEGKHHYEIPGTTKCWPIHLSEKGTQLIPHQLCYSNKEAVKELRKRILRYVKQNHQIDTLGFWPNDGGSYCDCPECKRDTDAIFRAVIDIAKDIKKINPKIKVEHLVYGAGVCDVPSADMEVSDNLSFFLCRPPQEQKKWAHWVQKQGLLSYTGDYVLSDNYAREGMVMLRPQYAYKVVEEMISNNIHGIGSFYLETTSWWRNCLNMYFLGKASLNNPPHVDQVVEDFCKNYFGSMSDCAAKLFKAADDTIIPLDLTGYGKYYPKHIKSIEHIVNKLKKLICKYQSIANTDDKFARLLRYCTHLQKCLSTIPLRVCAKKATKKSPKQALRYMLEVARCEQQIIEMCHESALAGDSVLDMRFSVSRRWERFDKDLQLLAQAEKNTLNM